MITWIDFVLLGLYALGMIGIAIYTHNRSKSVNDFLLAGKKGLNGWMSAFAYGTTYFSAVIFIGYAGKFGSAFGLASIWIGVGNAIIGSLFAWMVLAKRTKNMTHNLNSKTMPDFFEKRYGSQRLKLVSAIIIFIFLIPYSASVYSGLSALFETVFRVDGWIIMIALAALTAVYLFFGGYFATALSDFIQGIIMLCGVVAMVIFFLANSNVGWDLSELMSNVDLNLFIFDHNPSGKWLYDDGMSLMSLILLTSFGVWALPQTVHKYYAIRDDKAIKQGTIVSTAFALIIGLGAYFTGALYHFFKDLFPGVINPDYFVPNMMTLIPTGLIGVLAVLILSASMSTLSSVSLASASVVAVDIYKGKIDKKASDKKVNWTMRILCLVFIVISVVLAVLNEEFGLSAIAYMMGLSWGVLAGCFIGPFVLGLLWKKVSRPAVWTSVIGCLVLTATLIVVFGYDKNNWACDFGRALQDGFGCSPLIGVICMAFSMLSTFVVSLFTKAPNAALVETAFAKAKEAEAAERTKETAQETAQEKTQEKEVGETA